MLANICHNDGVAAGQPPQIVHHVRRVEVPGVGQVLDVAHRRRALAGLDGLEPRRALAAPRTRTTDARQQLFQHFAQIAHQRHVGLHVLVDLRGVDFDMNLLGLGGVGGERAGHAIVEAHAAGDEQIGFLNGAVHPRLAVHAHHAQAQRMRGRKTADAEQRKAHGNLGALGQRAHLLHGAGLDNAVSGENHRLLGIADQLSGCGEFRFLNAQHGMRAVGTRLCGFKVEDRRRLLRVLCNIHQHRAGTAGTRNLKRFTQHPRQVLGLVDEEVVFGHRQRNAGDVDFLKCVRAQHFARHVAGDAHDGDRVEHGGGDAGDEVGRAGTAGGNGHAHFARGARIAIGHVRRALLVAHQHVTDGELAQRIVGGQNSAARIAEDVGNALAHQRGPQNLRARQARGRDEVSVRVFRLRGGCCRASMRCVFFRLRVFLVRHNQLLKESC